MDTQPADYIRHRLVRFSDTIEDIREHYRELSAFGRYYAGAPYYEKSGILLLLEGIRQDPGIREELCTEFRRVLQKLESLEEELGEEYRARLREDLGQYTDVYAAAICHEQLGSLRSETDHDLFRRDLIGVLLHELEKDHDLADLKDLINALDSERVAPDSSSGSGNQDLVHLAAEMIRHDPDRSRIEN
jgi:hypothetical protein